MDRLKCPYCGNVIGEGPGCEHCNNVMGRRDIQQLEIANSRLEKMERHLASISGSLRNLLAIAIIVVVMYVLGMLASLIFGIASFSSMTRQMQQNINVIP
ncbi:hypothetical protein KDL44_00900 [bacterium]|nr:hypothetical protein [bacterium]